ncbi:MAG: pyridoxamine 5'-phosphate oxidase family protein [Actinobacteria bacterium]|nr:pyridoxamine 5'-phosphate oxidase family protein [Actinomycetota bacterium]
MKDTSWTVVSEETQLRAIVEPPVQRVADKVRTCLHELDRQWLAASPLCLIATSAPDGTCDVSPRGDPAGSTLVLDDSTLALPDRPGNRRVDGFRNLLGNPHVGLLYLVPGRGDTLRINGTAELISDAPFFEQLVVAGHRPELVLVVRIEEVFYHCSKAFLRSELWDPDTWAPDAVPSRARIAQALERPEESLEALTDYYGPRYAEKLYG